MQDLLTLFQRHPSLIIARTRNYHYGIQLNKRTAYTITAYTYGRQFHDMAAYHIHVVPRGWQKINGVDAKTLLFSFTDVP